MQGQLEKVAHARATGLNLGLNLVKITFKSTLIILEVNFLLYAETLNNEVIG